MMKIRSAPASAARFAICAPDVFAFVATDTDAAGLSAWRAARRLATNAPYSSNQDPLIDSTSTLTPSAPSSITNARSSAMSGCLADRITEEASRSCRSRRR